jgi:hypothetical protein
VSADRPLGPFLSTAQFWQLLDRWGVPDAGALDLIGFAGKVGKSGKRPRFRFSPHQKRLTAYLAEIDAALTAAGQDPTWLSLKSQTSPFTGQTPLALMTKAGEEGMGDTLLFLNRIVLRAALKSRQ